MDKWFPLPDDAVYSQDLLAMKFLESRGWILNRDWTWTPPVKFHTQSFFEYTCITYLIEEWDFGGEKDWFGQLGRCYCDKCLKENVK